jgi:hypothetical protein
MMKTDRSFVMEERRQDVLESLASRIVFRLD